MKKLLVKILLLISLLILSLITRFYRLDQPRAVIFDEVHYEKYVTSYLKGKYFFDNHPPLAKIMLAFFLKGKLNPDTSFKNIGEKFGSDVLGYRLRFLPAFFGSLLIVLVYLLTLKITNSYLSASLAGGAVLFNNAFIVHARWMGPDMIMLFFIFSAIYFFLLAESTKSQKCFFWFLSLSAIFLGISISIKWIGLIPAGIIFVYYFPKFLKRKIPYFKIKYLLILFTTIPFLIYYLSFCLHFSLLSPNASQKFSFKFISFKKFYEINKQMYSAQLGKQPHTYQSKFWTWPLMKRAVSYYHKVVGKNEKDIFIRNITLVGNPIIWWLSTLGIVIFFLLLLGNTIWRLEFFQKPFISVIAWGYLISFLPFSLIERSLFLYHYFSAYIFAVMATSYLITFILKRKILSQLFLIFLILINLILFVFLILRLNTHPQSSLNLSTKIGIFIIGINLLLPIIIRNRILILAVLTIGSFFLFLPLTYSSLTTYNNFYYLMWFLSWI